MFGGLSHSENAGQKPRRCRSYEAIQAMVTMNTKINCYSGIILKY